MHLTNPANAKCALFTPSKGGAFLSRGRMDVSFFESWGLSKSKNMEIKIQLPNPDDYKSAVPQWFAQMRISLKAAEKTYQEWTKGLTEEEKENAYINVGVPYELQETLLKQTTSDGSFAVNDGKTTSDFIQENLYLSVWSA